MVKRLMSGLLCLASLLYMGTAGVAVGAAAPIELRGIVEGFYGQPWSQAERLSGLRFMGEQGLNMYIYAPKDDSYHREKWREPYPAEECARMAELIQAAQVNHVEFVFALSPGLDLRLADAGYEEDIKAMVDKFSFMYELGVRRFAIFFDDIAMKDGRRQAEFINSVNHKMQVKFLDLQPLITVPTEYFSADMFDEGEVKEYTREFAGHLAGDVIVLYTGSGVVCEGLAVADVERVNDVYGRKMAVWWNYPVNDYLPEKLALGPITGMEAGVSEKLSGFIINPMEHDRLSRLAMQTGAAYALKPDSYDAEREWRRALTEQYGELAAAMGLFAEQSQRMENSWAHTGRADGSELRRKLDKFWSLLQNGRSGEQQAQLILADLQQLEAAVSVLQQQLPPEIKAECAPQLAVARSLVKADRAALQAALAHAGGDKAATLYWAGRMRRNWCAVQKEQAILSQATMLSFLRETAEFIGDGDLVTD